MTLRFTNPYGEVFYLQNLGNIWPHAPERRLIAATTPDRAKAREFATKDEATEVLVQAGGPAGWEVVP